MLRRDILKTFLGLSLYATGNHASAVSNSNEDPSCITEPDDTTEDIGQYFREHQFTPPEMTRAGLIWGYRPILYPVRFATAEVNHFPYLVHGLLSNPEGIDSTFNTTSEFYCVDGNKSSKYRITTNLSTPSFRHSKTRDEISKSLSGIKKDLSGLTYSERVRNVLEILANSFREEVYQLHTDWAGTPKTVIQLMSDGFGDCKDFALARALTAIDLGIKPEHVAVIAWYSMKEGEPAHANVSIYSPQDKAWFFVDGTGRLLNMQKGSTVIFQNHQAVKDLMGENGAYMSRVVPIAGITARGIFGFDSFEEIDGHYVAKSPETMSVDNLKRPLLVQKKGEPLISPQKPELYIPETNWLQLTL